MPAANERLLELLAYLEQVYPSPANILNRAFNARPSQSGDGVALTAMAHPEIVTGSGDLFRDLGLEDWDGHQPEDL